MRHDPAHDGSGRNESGRPSARRPGAGRYGGAGRAARRRARQPGRAVPEGLDGRGAAHRPGPADPAAGAAHGTVRWSPCTWDEALDRVAAAFAADPRAQHGAGRRRGVRRRRADQREGLPARQVRPGRAAARAHRLQRPVLHVVGRGGAATARSGSTAGCRSRSPTSPRPDAVLLAGGNVAETMPPFMRHLAASRTRGGALIVVDPRRTATARSRPTLHLQPTPGTDLALANGLLHLALAEGLVDERLHRRAHDRLRRRPARWRPRTGPSGSSGSPACRSRDARRRSGCWPRAERADVLTARGAEQHARAPTRSAAFINLALALGLPGRRGQRLRLPDRAGQRAGRPRARAEGRPAARLPADRRPGGARARRRGVGRRPGRPARPGALAPSSCCDALGHARAARGRCWCSARTPWCPRRDAAAVEERLGALDLLVVADFVPSETARRADVVLPVDAVGRGGRHDDQPRRPGPAPPPGRPRRRPASAPTSRSSPALADRLGRAGRVGPPTREEVFDELRRATAGGPADYSGITYERIDAGGRRVLALPGAATIRAPRGCSSTGSDTRTAGPGSSPSSTAAPARTLDDAYPLYAHHRPGAGALPVRCADPAGRGAGRGGARGVRRAPPRPGGAAAASRTASRSAWTAAAARSPSGRGSPTPIRARHGLHARSTGRGRAAPTCSPTPPWTRCRGCRSSRCAPSAWNRPGPTPAPGRVAIRREGLLTRR